MFIHWCIWGGVRVGILFNDLSVSVRITSLVREAPLTASLLCTGRCWGHRSYSKILAIQILGSPLLHLGIQIPKE